VKMYDIYGLPKVKKPFYTKGLKFECQKECFACCGGGPGYVWIEEEEIPKLSALLGISDQEFLDNYTKKANGRLSLLDIASDNWNCIMLKNGRCSIYENRPIQCRTYPFWHSNLHNQEYWDIEKEACPGIGKGKEYTMEQIEAIADGEETIDSIK